MPKYPSTSLVTISEKLAKVSDEQIRKDIETEIRKADLDLLKKINEMAQQSLAVSTKEQAYTPTFTGFGTPTAVNFTWTRVGNRIKVMGKFTSGTNTATEARISLPGSLVSDAALVTSIQDCGTYLYAVTGANSIGACLIESGVGYITLGFASGTTNPLDKVNGNLFNNASTFTMFFEFGISGWNV